MSIYVIEQGRRIATPFDALFPRTVQSVTRSARIEAIHGETAGGSAFSPAPSDAAAGISAYREQSGQSPARRRVNTAADIMTSHPLCLAPDAMVASAWQLMQQHGFHHVLVVAPDFSLLGIVSDRDIWELLAAATNLLSVPSAANISEPAFETAAQLQDAGQLQVVGDQQREVISPTGLAAMAITRVDAVMISQIVCADAETSIRRLAEVMLLHKVDALPVTDDAQHVQGIVTRTDLLRSLVLDAPLELWA